MTGLILWALQILSALFLTAGLFVHAFISPFPETAFNLFFVFAALFHGTKGMSGIIDETIGSKSPGIGKRYRKLFSDYADNSQAGTLCFIMHRATGILLFLFFVQHLFTNYLVSAYIPAESLPFLNFLRHGAVIYLALVLLGFHLTNGLRLIFLEVTGYTHLQKKLAAFSLFSGLLFAILITMDFRGRF